MSRRSPAAVLLLDLASEQVAGATLEVVSTVLYYKVLQWAGYSRNLKVAAFERKLKKDGRYEEFEKLFEGTTGEPWTDYQNDELVVDSLLPELAHRMYPEFFKTTQSFTTTTSEVIYLLDDRIKEIIDIVRETSGKDYIIFVIDEVGQYVGSNQNKILDLQGLAENLKNIGDGKAWIVGTAQQTLTEDDPRAALNSPDDQRTRNRLSRFVSEARSLLTEEFTRQLQQEYGLDPRTGDVADLAKLGHLDDARLETARVLRQIFAHYLASDKASGAANEKSILDRIVREQAFTILNRLAALRMAEVRGLLIESVGNGYQAKGFQLYAGLAGTALGETGDAYRIYLFSVFDELAQDLPNLFGRYSPQGLLFPRQGALLSLLRLINDAEIERLWGEDETIGWIYQYFNSAGRTPFSSTEHRPLITDYRSEDDFVGDVPRLIIEHNIYGVEIDPRAAQIASVALWLRAQRAWHDAGVKAKDRLSIERGNIVAAVSPPAERELRQQFASELDQRDAELFEKTLQLLKRLPELGVLLQVERELPYLVRQVYVGKGTDLFAKQEQEGWQQAEECLREGLIEFAKAATSTYEGRLFAQDALHGLRLSDLTVDERRAIRWIFTSC